MILLMLTAAALVLTTGFLALQAMAGYSSLGAHLASSQTPVRRRRLVLRPVPARVRRR